MSSTTDEVTLSPSDILIGRVKWFNNKAGYGFITVTDGDKSGSDIFVHHTAINVENQQYKYLVQGEYVQFNLVNTTSGNHEWQASGVNGIKGGKLMCETRREFKLARTVYKTEKTEKEETTNSQEVKMPRQQKPPRSRGEGPREGEQKEWTLVTDKKVTKRRGRPPRQTSDKL
jgi:cold shock CspA family protein